MRTFFLLIATTIMLAAVACFGGPDDPGPPTAPTTAVVVPTTPPAITVTGSRIQVAEGSGNVGQVVPIPIHIYDAKTGIAGYALVVSVADPSIARISNVSLPDFNLTIVSELPADSVDITAVDLPGLLEGDIKEALLATLDIELLKAGTSDLLLEIRSVDDDDGNAVKPQLMPGKITVN